jgi:hypothetical protein
VLIGDRKGVVFAFFDFSDFLRTVLSSDVFFTTMREGVMFVGPEAVLGVFGTNRV